MASRSIRWRLQAWLALFLVLLLLGFGFSVWQLERIQMMRRVDAELEKKVSLLSVAVRGGEAAGMQEQGPGPGPAPDWMPDGEIPPLPPDRDPGEARGGPGGGMRRRERPSPVQPRVPDEVRKVFAAQPAEGAFYYCIWHGDREEARSGAAPADVEPPQRLGRDTMVRYRERGNLREAYHFTERGHCILVGTSLDAQRKALMERLMTLALIGAGVLVTGLAGGWWLTTRAIRPIEEIGATARRISDGDLSQRIPVAGDSELADLAVVLNTTFSRLEQAFDRQRQFTADASHELRTPLTLMISEAQTALARERSPEDYREALSGCLDAAQQMRRLTEALLELARTDGGSGAARDVFDLSVCVREVAERFQPMIAERGLKLEMDLAPVEIEGGVERFGLVVANLLSNAIHYNVQGGTVWLITRRAGDSAEFVVEDTGIGISPEDQSQVFERFFRADKARSRIDGKFGLGLAICRAVVEADGGTIQLQSREGKGSRFTVRYPVPR
ncbi:HAMP domain-containing protein [Luteolibacter ambystomatis]|uniref:histidine kinase n=1 Tax=Luteolibacter ambystomatis TaxID=2824561 RepID=A0A975PGT8_9BACT|nr:ATP-binding protein [Luteolibacter ambystomatis]QUE52915.1 HAMP domain-containing protein [Luteolibacter ambystomatis]